MANLEEIIELRTAESGDPGQESERDLKQRSRTERKRKPQNFGGSHISAQAFSSSQVPEEGEKESENRRQSARRPADSNKGDTLPVQEGQRAQFYEHYRMLADSYDKKFIKRHDQDLNTTLIFAGLFSAVTSAFIIQFDSQLQPDPSDEIPALLRLLIYKIDNTTFGGAVPVLEDWNGPPPKIVTAQAMLFASFTLSILSAFLAMLRKQWLDHYAEADMRGSVIELSQNRQRKLDGIHTWHFDTLIGSLPLMLQAAALLLGGGISLYLWENDSILASVVLGITLSGCLMYFFITLAGAISPSCPYQTFGVHLLRRVRPLLRRRVFSALGINILDNSGQRAAALDLRCILWILQTSFDKSVFLSTLKYLATITEFINLDPALVIACFDIFAECISVSNRKLVITQGLEQLATVSARCFLHTFRHLSATDPNSNVLIDLRRRYDLIVPPDPDFRGLPFYRTMTKIHALVDQNWDPRPVQWTDYSSSHQELTPFARHMVDIAQAEYQQTQNKKVPCWILRFALHFLSLDPLSPTSVIADCLTIIAIALDRDPIGVSISDEGVRMEQVSSLIIQTLETIAEVPGMTPIYRSKRKAISALFPYAVRLAQDDGQWEMINAILRFAPKSKSGGFMWHRIGPYITTLSDSLSPTSLDMAITLASPCADWVNGPYTENAVARWAAAALTTTYSEEVCRSAVDALLKIARNDSLRPHVPIEIWAWLKRRPSLPPVCRGQTRRATPGIVRHIRGLGDIEILKSYFLLVWSEWDIPYDDDDDDITATENTIRQEFCGFQMRRHREDLKGRLDHIREQLDQGLEHFKQCQPWIEENDIGRMKKRYGKLKEVLLEADGV